jgi:hypothetical protein
LSSIGALCFALGGASSGGTSKLIGSTGTLSRGWTGLALIAKMMQQDIYYNTALMPWVVNDVENSISEAIFSDPRALKKSINRLKNQLFFSETR